MTEKAVGGILRKNRDFWIEEAAMNTAVTVICCLIPCIGIVLGLMLIQKGKKKKESGGEISGPSAKLLKAAGVRILIVAAVLLIAAILVLALVPMNTPKSHLVTAILLVTAQYAAAMVLIFMISGMLHKDRKDTKDTSKREDA